MKHDFYTCPSVTFSRILHTMVVSATEETRTVMSVTVSTPISESTYTLSLLNVFRGTLRMDDAYGWEEACLNFLGVSSSLSHFDALADTREARAAIDAEVIRVLNFK